MTHRKEGCIRESRDLVAVMVNTYHPNGAQTVVKDGKYQKLVEQISFWEDDNPGK